MYKINYLQGDVISMAELFIRVVSGIIEQENFMAWTKIKPKLYSLKFFLDNPGINVASNYTPCTII